MEVDLLEDVNPPASVDTPSAATFTASFPLAQPENISDVSAAVIIEVVSQPHGVLKRCASVPNIDSAVSDGASQAPAAAEHCESGEQGLFNATCARVAPSPTYQIVDRTRRFSTSSVSLHGLHSPTVDLHSTTARFRLDQIRLEESIPQSDREVAHEKELQSTMTMAHSWDELSLDDTLMGGCDPPLTAYRSRPHSFNEPLHVVTSAGGPGGALYSPYFGSPGGCLVGSPSPTRVGKQCYSPSLQQAVVRVGAAGGGGVGGGGVGGLTPSSSPSPTRKAVVRRSISPIVLRPSPLSGAVKRKIEMENPEMGGEEEAHRPAPYKKMRASSFSLSSVPGAGRAPSPYQPLILSIASKALSSNSNSSSGSSMESSSLSGEHASSSEPPLIVNSPWAPRDGALPPRPPSLAAGEISPLSRRQSKDPCCGGADSLAVETSPLLWRGKDGCSGGRGLVIETSLLPWRRHTLSHTAESEGCSPQFTFRPVRDSMESGCDSEESPAGGAKASPLEKMESSVEVERAGAVECARMEEQRSDTPP